MNYSYRLDLTFGFILKSIEDGSYRYFYPHNNDGILKTPFSVTNPSDLFELIEQCKSIDIAESVIKQRPDTKWKVYRITNVRYIVYKLLDKKLGIGIVPKYIKVRKHIISLDVSRATNKPYDDYLCAFRCLAYHRGNQTFHCFSMALMTTHIDYFEKSNFNTYLPLT